MFYHYPKKYPHKGKTWREKAHRKREEVIMGKNNAFINKQKIIHQKIADTLPKMYAAFALAIWRSVENMPEDDKQELISILFAETQCIWQESADNHFDIVEECERVTGIDVRRATHE